MFFFSFMNWLRVNNILSGFNTYIFLIGVHWTISNGFAWHKAKYQGYWHDVKFLTTYLVSATFRLPKKINWAWYKADDLAQYIHTWRYVSNEKPCWLHVSREVLYRKIGQQNQVSLGKFDAGSILNSQYNQSLLYIHMRRVTCWVDI